MGARVKRIKPEELDLAYKGSWYTITGAGGDPYEWVAGYEEKLAEKKIGKPKQWYIAKGYDINNYTGVHEGPHAFNPELTILLFPLDGLQINKLSLFKILLQDRWFDDIVDNTRRHAL